MTMTKIAPAASRFGNVNTRLHHLYKRGFKQEIDGLGRFSYPDDIIRGGIISPANYARQTQRVVILLKEGWADNNERWDWPSAGRQKLHKLRSGQTTGLAWNLVHTMGAWSYLVSGGRSLEDGLAINSYANVGREEKASGLEAVGVTNVKKCYGQRSSADSDIRRWGRCTKEMWLQELQIMQPDTVLCGGQVVYDVLSQHTNCESEGSVSTCGKDFRYSYCTLLRGKRFLLVELPHPTRSPSLSFQVLAQLKRQGLF
jgi:hypothetical protein